jgi:hypothetical protein
MKPSQRKTIIGDAFPESEIERRRDEVIRRMANTPPQPKVTSLHRQGKKKKADAGRAVRKAHAGRER